MEIGILCFCGHKEANNSWANIIVLAALIDKDANLISSFIDLSPSWGYEDGAWTVCILWIENTFWNADVHIVDTWSLKQVVDDQEKSMFFEEKTINLLKRHKTADKSQINKQIQCK